MLFSIIIPLYNRPQEIKELLESLTRFFNEKKITVYSYPPPTLYLFCGEGKAKTKKEVMRVLAVQYPELTFYYHKEKRNKNKYYIKLFEAVAVATLHAQQLKTKY